MLGSFSAVAAPHRVRVAVQVTTPANPFRVLRKNGEYFLRHEHSIRLEVLLNRARQIHWIALLGLDP